MRPHLEELMSYVVPGSEVNQSSTAGRNAHHPAADGSDNAAKHQPQQLSVEEIECLESILEKPNLTSTQRRDELGHSTYKFDQLKKQLLAKGLVDELSINFGSATGGICKFLELTERGYAALGKKPKWKRPSGMSAEHFWWQQRIAEFYCRQGFEVEIEMCLNGKRADVGFIKDGMKVAVEVGLTAKNEVVNVQKNLEAGFDHVLVACRDSKVRKAVEENLNRSVDADKLQRVKLILLSDFSFVKEIFGKSKVRNALQRI
jgi:hypothetical protein